MEQIKHTTMAEYLNAVNVMRILPPELHKQVMEYIKQPPLFLKVTMMPAGRCSTFRIASQDGYYHHDAGDYGFTLAKRGDRLEAFDIRGANREHNDPKKDVIVEITEAEYHEDNRGYYSKGGVERLLMEWQNPPAPDDNVPF